MNLGDGLGTINDAGSLKFQFGGATSRRLRNRTTHLVRHHHDSLVQIPEPFRVVLEGPTDLTVDARVTQRASQVLLEESFTVAVIPVTNIACSDTSLERLLPFAGSGSMKRLDKIQLQINGVSREAVSGQTKKVPLMQVAELERLPCVVLPGDLGKLSLLAHVYRVIT